MGSGWEEVERCRKASKNIHPDGYQWVVDIDLARYFDTVNYDKLMSFVAREVTDKECLSSSGLT